MNKIVFKTHVPLEKGIVIFFNKGLYNSLYIGTLQDYILNYDIRINSICKSNKYYSNKQIIRISLNNFRYCFRIQNKYLNMKN